MLVLREGARRLHEVRGKERLLLNKTAAEEVHKPQNTRERERGREASKNSGEVRDKQISQRDGIRK